MRRWQATLTAGFFACTVYVSGAWAQANDPGPPEAPIAVADTTPEAAPPRGLDRSRWIILMAILGEQLPENVVLRQVSFDAAPADVRIRVTFPAADAGPLHATLMERLQRHFATAVALPAPAAGAENVVAFDITLTGVPTLSEYRARTTASTENVVAPVPPPEATPAPAPPPVPATPAPPTVATRRTTPQLRRVTQLGAGGGLVAQVVLAGREYIVREGYPFASRRYRFVSPAPAAQTAPEMFCITIEHVESGEQQVICTVP